MLRFLVHLGIRANHVTLFAILLSLTIGSCIFYYSNNIWPYILVPIGLFVRMALNAIDGMLAREFDQGTNIGAILNELGDVFSDVFLYLPFMLHAVISQYAIISFVILAIISEMTGVIGIQIGASRRYDGPMGKSDRAFLMGAIAILLSLNLSFELSPWVDIALYAASFLTLITIFNRARKALAEVAS